MIGSFVMFTINSAFLQNIPFFQTYPQASLFFNGILIIIIIAKYPGRFGPSAGFHQKRCEETLCKGEDV